jgi:hypothetical protein
MAHKMSWLIISAAAVGTAIGATYLVTSRTAVAAKGGPEPTDVVERLERLERGMPEVKKGLANAGAQMGALALSMAAAEKKPKAVDGEGAGAATGQLSGAERRAKEKQYYDRLDESVRAGGGADSLARLRKNIEQASTRPSYQGGAKLDIAKLDCNDAYCRVEVRTPGTNVGAEAMAGAQVLAQEMGDLSMRPHTPGQPSVYYVAAPGKTLPAFDF